MLKLDELPLPQRQFYREGYEARMAGKPIADSPYDPHSHSGCLWDEGWTDADEGLRRD